MPITNRRTVRPEMTLSRFLDAILETTMNSTSNWEQLQQDFMTLRTVFETHCLDDDLRQVDDKLDELKRRSELLVFVFGEGNFGKSSLVNKLLGREVAEVSILPKTWRVDLFHSLPVGQEEYAILRRNGIPLQERLTIEEARAVCLEQEKLHRAELLPKTEMRGAAFDGQILDIHWHFT